jgi:DNA-directed RNA polymerase subunit RPC12/RpoP
MNLLQRLTDSKDAENEGDEEADEVEYRCAACGMLIKRSCSELNDTWCPRCGATSIRERPL